MKSYPMADMILMLVAAWPVSVLAAERPDVVIEDFEGPDYGKWKVEGEAFGPGPAHGTLPNQMPVSGYQGQGLVNSYYKGDKSTGKLTSPPIKIERKFINFLIGGGKDPEKLYLGLLIAGKKVRTATGPNDRPGGSEALDWESWDVSEFEGREAVLVIADNATGGWGHINVDQITQSDHKREGQRLIEQRELEKLIVTMELYNETYRPQFHFTARKNWLNDPNGLVFYKGEYHLFFQHNPDGINWGNMTWGHAVSKDLVHWEQLEHAIHPDNLGTIFSGSAVVDWKNTTGFQTGEEKALVCIYTSAGKPFTQSIAYSNDKGRTFTKYEKNPVLPHFAGSNRDPKVIWHEPAQKWIMALYKDKSLYAFFSSPDLKTWTFLHDLDVPGCGECPDFFPMPVDGDRKNIKWVWTAANGQYLIGGFDGQKFTPENLRAQRADWGRNYYAVQSYSDIPEADGRRIQIAWMNGGKYPKMPFNQQMSFPCEMTLRTFPEGLRICRLPVKEIEVLHGKEHAWKDLTVQPGENPLKDLAGELFDIRAELELGAEAECGFTLRGETVRYSAKEKKLTCLGGAAPVEPTGKRLKLQILLDRTSIEVFAQDGKYPMTSCFLPKPDQKLLSFFAQGGPVKIVSLKVIELRSAWPQAARPAP